MLDYSFYAMAEKVEQSPEHLGRHVAVGMKDCIAVFISSEYAHEYWQYNLWTEHWRKCPVKQNVCLPYTQYLCGVAIQSVIYMFGGGRDTCNLWKLTQNTDDSFEWITILMEYPKMPSPRISHCGWEYVNKMWIFGGYGISQVNYLNDHGDFAGEGLHGMYGKNNQLFSYDPLMQSWKNMACYGDVPSPSESASVATNKNKVWLHGGYDSTGWNNTLYELSMTSLLWTKIYSGIPRSQYFRTSSMTPLSHNRLAIHGYTHKGRATWIFDLESYRLRKFRADTKCYCQQLPSTGTSGVNGDVIILGGHYTPCNRLVFSVMLEPKRLQQFAMRIIHKYKKDLPWKSLPPMLKNKLFGTE